MIGEFEAPSKLNIFKIIIASNYILNYLNLCNQMLNDGASELYFCVHLYIIKMEKRKDQMCN